MKLIFAIVNKEDSYAVSQGLTKDGFAVTKLATTGGFLMAGNVTLIIGTEDEKVDRVIDLIKEFSKQRIEIVASTATYGVGVASAIPLEVQVGGATIFVTDVARYEKI